MVNWRFWCEPDNDEWFPWTDSTRNTPEDGPFVDPDYSEGDGWGTGDYTARSHAGDGRC